MASSTARGKDQETSRIGDALYRLAVLWWIKIRLSDLRQAHRNNAVTILNSEKFQNWLVQRHPELADATTEDSPRLKSQAMEAYIGNLALDNPKDTIDYVFDLLDLHLWDDVEWCISSEMQVIIEFFQDLQGNHLPGTWQYSSGTKDRWLARKGNVIGEGSSHGEARWNAIFDYYFPVD
jgi:hypothetical protein